MDRLDFRTRPFAESQWRRLRARSRTTAARFRGLPPPAIAIGVAIAVLAADGGIVVPATRVNGVPVAGNHILVVQDNSGSVGDPNPELERQKVLLGTSVSGLVKVVGFGVSSAGAANLLHVLEDAIPAQGAVDTVYVFSDFAPFTPEYDCNDFAGLERVQRLIRQHHVRLYLSTVNMMPSQGLIAVARESGGDVLGIPSPADSLAARQNLCHFDR